MNRSGSFGRFARSVRACVYPRRAIGEKATSGKWPELMTLLGTFAIIAATLAAAHVIMLIADT